MKKTTLLFILSFIINSNLYAAPDGLRIDRFNLDVYTDGIVARLWLGKEVPDDTIERAFSAISMSKELADASADEEKKSAIAACIEEFVEFANEIAKDSGETEEKIRSLKSFIEKVRSRGEKNDPIAVRCVLHTVIDKYY